MQNMKVAETWYKEMNKEKEVFLKTAIKTQTEAE
jgi:hypothetical protein